MAKFLQRMGTQQQVFSYDITVHYLQISLTLPVRINVIWKRRKKRIETKLKPALSPSVGSVEINETLTMINTLYQEKSGKFQRKKALLTVQAIVDGRGTKKIGEISLNINEYFTTPLREKVFSLEKCPDKNSKICLSVQATALGGLEAADNQSEATGTVFSMGTEGNFEGELFEQDLAGFEEEESKASVLSTSSTNNTKPPRQPMLRLPEMPKVVNPVRINESMKEDENTVKALQSQNVQLATEKETLKEELNSLVERSKKEKDGLYEHIKTLDAENTKLKKGFEKLNERVKRRDETVAKLKSMNTNLLEDLKTLEEGGDTVKLRERICELENTCKSQTETIQQLSSGSSSEEMVQTYKAELAKLREEINGYKKRERKNSRNESEETVDNLKHSLRETRSQLEDLQFSHKQLSEENEELKNQLNKASSTEFSDPANIILQDQVQNLRKKLETIEKSHEQNAESLRKRIRELENELQAAEKQRRELGQILNKSEDEHQPSLKLAQIEIEEFKNKIALLQEDYKNMEKKYVDSKMGWAKSDIEKENYATKYREAQEKLRDYSSEYTMMEVELYKLNERFGQTLNDNNELEMELQALRRENEELRRPNKKKR